MAEEHGDREPTDGDRWTAPSSSWSRGTSRTSRWTRSSTPPTSSSSSAPGWPGRSAQQGGPLDPGGVRPDRRHPGGHGGDDRGRPPQGQAGDPRRGPADGRGGRGQEARLGGARRPGARRPPGPEVDRPARRSRPASSASPSSGPPGSCSTEIHRFLQGGTKLERVVICLHGEEAFGLFKKELRRGSGRTPSPAHATK